jgi:CBS domain-containing protein
MTTVLQLLDEKGHDVITVGSDETVFDAIRKMAEKNIGSLVVCEAQKSLALLQNDTTPGTCFWKAAHYRAREWGTLWKRQSCSPDPI